MKIFNLTKIMKIIRDVVLLRKIQKVVIEALNVCPDECISDLYEIFNVLKQDFPSVKDLNKDFYKEEDEGKGKGKKESQEKPERTRLKEYLGESVEKMMNDM